MLPALSFSLVLLLTILVYITGVAIARFIVTYMQDVSATDLESVGIKGIEHFASVPTSMMTLLKAAFGGVDWGEYLDILHLVGAEAAGLFCFYMLCMLIVIHNVITGVFVEHTMTSAKEDRDVAIQGELSHEAHSVHRLKRLFLEVIHENNPDEHFLDDMSRFSKCIITEAEFYKIIVHDKVRAYFAVMGLDVQHAQGMFRLLDMDGDGTVGLEEFVMGCLRLKGDAKAVDVATLMYENKRVMKKFNKLSENIRHEFGRLYQALNWDRPRMLEQNQSFSRRISPTSPTSDGELISCQHEHQQKVQM